MQHSSPALSSPSTGFFGPRSSPLFNQSIDQPDPHPPPSSASDFPRSSLVVVDDDNDEEQLQQQAPPKQLAHAMECLGHALRLIADVRMGGDMLLEAVGKAVSSQHDGQRKPIDGIIQTSNAVGAYLDELRATGRKLEASGVLNGAQQRFEEKQPWGLHVPLICSDGAIVAYAWKRQIAGQAAASAVDRTRLALKAFTDQKKRYFPSFGSSIEGSGESSAMLDKKAKLMSSEGNTSDFDTNQEEFQGAVLMNTLKSWQTETSGMSITAFSRLGWLKHNSSKKGGLMGDPSLGVGKLSHSIEVSGDACLGGKVSILEVIVPSVFKAIVSLFPSASAHPDAISVFAVDEVQNSLGTVSSYAVFRQMTENATCAMQNFLQFSPASALNLLLHWLYLHRSLFSKPCSRCRRILAIDLPTDLLLPPVLRPASQVIRASSSQLLLKVENFSDDRVLAYHPSCMPRDSC